MGRLAVSTYETRYGTGVLRWRGDVLVAHELPGKAAPGASVTSAGEDDNELTVRKGLRLLLESYFSGRKADFDLERLPLDLDTLTEFEYRVATVLAATKPGELISYAGLAVDAGYPGAARAVGNYMARNRWPIIIPCHRVIRSDGQIGGFAYGEQWKLRLLALEGYRPERRRC